jgi:hypothetical protein
VTSEEVVRLLEAHWQDIREQLGDRWEPFLEEYGAIVDGLVEDERRAVERAADEVCRLLKRDEYTAGLLSGSAAPPSTSKLPLDEEKSVPEQTAVRQIHNRMLALRDKPEAAAAQRPDD